MLGDLAHQRFVADLFTKTCHHRSDLRVKQRLRDDPVFDAEDLKVLPRRVEYLHHIGISEQIHQRIKRQTIGQWINQNGIRLAVAAIGQLDQAKLGIVSAFAQEFCVDRDIRGFSRPRAEFGKVRGRRYDVHRLGRLFLMCRVTPSQRIAQFRRVA